MVGIWVSKEIHNFEELGGQSLVRGTRPLPWCLLTEGAVYHARRCAARPNLCPGRKFRGEDRMSVEFLVFNMPRGQNLVRGARPLHVCVGRKCVFFMLIFVFMPKRSVAQCRVRWQCNFHGFWPENIEKINGARVLSCELRGLGPSHGDQQT